MTDRQLIPCPICHGSTKEIQGVLACIANCRTQFWGLGHDRWYVSTEDQVLSLKAEVTRLTDLIESKPDTVKSDHFEYLCTVKDYEILRLNEALTLATEGMTAIQMTDHVIKLLEGLKKMFSHRKDDLYQTYMEAIESLLKNKVKVVDDFPVGYQLVPDEDCQKISDHDWNVLVSQNTQP